MAVREAEGREATPSAGVIESQSEDAGVIFIDEDKVGPGVRLREPTSR